MPFGIGVFGFNAKGQARKDSLGIVQFIRKLLQADERMHASEEFVSFKALADTMIASGIDLIAAKREVFAEFTDAVTALLERAQRAGRVRPDVSIADVSALMAGLGHADPSMMGSSQRSRCVALVCDSLLVDARSLLPLRCPDEAGPTGSEGPRAGMRP